MLFLSTTPLRKISEFEDVCNQATPYPEGLNRIMSISFDAERQIFHLQTRACSYAMQIGPAGILTHLYWGAPLRRADVSHLLTLRDRAFSPDLGGELRNASLDTWPQEFPSYGGGDFRAPAIEVTLANGSSVSEFRYQSHRISAGKPALDGLPATYVENNGEADTLEIELVDDTSGLQATLVYSAFGELGALARSVKLRNVGTQTLRIGRILSASVDFPSANWDLLHLSGAWARERDIERHALRPGAQGIESRRGASGHEHNPFVALLAPGTTESHGEVFAMNLVYSGSFTAGAEVGLYSTTRLQIGLNPFDFEWQLGPGETFQAPEATLVYSAAGLGAMSRTFHELYRARLCRGAWRDRARPILLNSWEAMYFDVSQPKIEKLAQAASRCGIELLVLDDGWFGARNDDHTSLGDWFVHPAKFPDGLQVVAQAVNDLGLKFGLWFEPEMVSPQSELYRAHPDWCLHVPNRRRTQARQQLILDLSRPEVCDALIGMVGDILRAHSIEYVKWDMNRNMTEIGSAAWPPEQQRGVAHRYILGLYRVLETLTREFPHVLFESCSGGGGRFDAGMLFYMPQVWTSDNTDAISRLRVQEGTGLVYPAVSMGAHVSDVPNHQVGREASLSTLR